MILGELKAAIAEQESVMETQDQVLQNREDQIKELREGTVIITSALGSSV